MPILSRYLEGPVAKESTESRESDEELLLLHNYLLRFRRLTIHPPISRCLQHATGLEHISQLASVFARFHSRICSTNVAKVRALQYPIARPRWILNRGVLEAIEERDVIASEVVVSYRDRLGTMMRSTFGNENVR
jgi:hypothetical protein